MQTRLYGLASDQITSMDVVLADGSQVTANANSNPDLFWALRGAGSSSFGIVLRYTVNVFQMPQNAVFVVIFGMVSIGVVSSIAAPNCTKLRA